MFYIKIKSTFLDLAEEFSIDLVIESPMFLQDRIPVAYTTSADFPLTPKNKALLDHPDRVNNKKRVWEYDSVVLGYGARPMYYGILIVREIGGKLSWNFQASDEFANIKKNMNELDWGQVFFGVVGYDLFLRTNYEVRTNPQFGITPPLYYGDAPMITYKNHWVSARENELLYTNGPIKTSDQGIPTKYYEDELAFVYALYGQNQWFNPWGNSTGHIIPSVGGYISYEGVRYAHSPMYPQLRAYQVLKKLLNLADIDNPFFSEELFRVVITSHFHTSFRDDLIQKWAGVIVDNDYPDELTPEEDMILKIASYQPATPASEILKSLLNMVCGTLFRYQDNGVGVFKVKLAEDLIKDPTFEDWDKLLGTKLVLSRELAQDYVYGYDDFKEPSIKIDPEFQLTTITALIAAPVNDETGEQLYYIQTTGQQILKKLAPKLNETDPDKFLYELKDSGMGSSESKDGYQINSTLAPMDMLPEVGIESFVTSPTQIDKRIYVPIYKGERSVNYKPHVMMYFGNIENKLNPPFTAPYLSYHNYDAGGARLGELSLQWHGLDGLLETYHKNFKKWIEKDKLTAYGEFIFSPYFIKDIDLSKKILVRGKLWWIKKIVIPMSKKKIEPAKIDLIEAPAVPSASDGSGSGSDEGSASAAGICLEFRIDMTVFNPAEDGFDIYFRRPDQPYVTMNYGDFTSFEEGDDIVFFLCALAGVVALIQDGEPVPSVNGLTIIYGGSCTVDGECMP